MTDAPLFRGAVHQNPFLAQNSREVHAVITVDADAGPDDKRTGELPAAAEVLIIDRSGSMGYPSDKLAKAIEAAGAAIDELRDGVHFAVIAGSTGAQVVWPAEPKLLPANAETRAEAKTALTALSPGGGTTIGQWLRLANELLSDHPDAIRHVILLTDGRNQHETAAELTAAVHECEGVFSCDCRGVGIDWSVSELRVIASGLLGTVGLIAEPAGLADDFQAMMAASMRKAVAEVGLRLWTPTGATVTFIKQTAPTIEDLTLRRTDVDARTGDYPTGAWGTESRDYHVCIDVEPGDVGDEKLAGRVTFVRQDAGRSAEILAQEFAHKDSDGATTVAANGLVRAIWTDSLAQATMINGKVAAVTGRAELAERVRDGLDAYKRGDAAEAVAQLGEAHQLAVESQDTQMLERLGEIYDVHTRTIQLGKLSKKIEIGLEIESTKTTLLHRSGEA